MISKLAWQTFKNTGDINTFLELKQVTEIEKSMGMISDEISKNERNSNSRKQLGRF